MDIIEEIYDIIEMGRHLNRYIALLEQKSDPQSLKEIKAVKALINRRVPKENPIPTEDDIRKKEVQEFLKSRKVKVEDY
jgi:hypothetical protein